MATYAEQLTEVQTAISAILTGSQSYSIAGRSLSRADLKILYDQERFLRRMVARESAGGVSVRGITPVDS